jgi:hypothetical protein
LLLAWPSFLGFPHSGAAPWARRHPPSMAGGGSRGIHAARPTPRHLRSACTQVAICVVWDIAHLEAKSKANAALGFHANPVGDAGGHDGTGRDSDDSGLSAADESPDLPLSSDRGPGCRTAPAAPTGLRCAAGNLDTPRNRGAADTALANARPVSPSASYLKRHQVTKCPCSWFGPRSSGSLTSAPLRGPAAIRHPWRGAALAASMPLGPLRATCVQPAPKSRFVLSEPSRA